MLKLANKSACYSTRLQQVKISNYKLMKGRAESNYTFIEMN